jgi:hypothetical protein
MNQYNNATLIDVNELPAGYIYEPIQGDPKNLWSKIQFQGIL